MRKIMVLVSSCCIFWADAFAFDSSYKREESSRSYRQSAVKSYEDHRFSGGRDAAIQERRRIEEERYRERNNWERNQAIESINRERNEMHREFDRRMRDVDRENREIDQWQNRENQRKHANHQAISHEANNRRDALNRKRDRANREFDNQIALVNRRYQ